MSKLRKLPKLSIDVLGLRDFRFFLLTRMFSITAIHGQAVIVGWHVYELTQSPLMLGLVGLAEAVPALVFAFFSGHVVDNSRPHRVFLMCLLAHLVNTCALFVVTGGFVETSKLFELVWIFSGVFFSGIARSFIMPSSFVVLSHIIPREQVTAAQAWSSSGFQLSMITGPALAGLLYGGYGPTIAWAFPLLLFLCAPLLLLAMGSSTRQYRSAHKREKAWTSMTEGWRYIWGTPVVLSALTLDMFAVLFGGAVAMLPAYAKDVLHVGSEGLGLLRAAPALGAIFTAVFLALYPLQIIKGRTLLTVMLGFGTCIIGFGLSTSFTLSMIFLGLSGAFDSVNILIRSMILQLTVPENMRGRVASINSMFIVSSNELGAFESGVAAAALGLVPSVVVGGAMSVLIACAIGALSPGLRRLVLIPNAKE